jgi:hypothetical protein
MEKNNNSKVFLSMLYGYINSIFETPPSEEEFSNAADSFRQMVQNNFQFTDEEFENLKKTARENIVVKQDVGISLPDLSNGHKSWLPARRAEIDFFFWNRYRKYLEVEKHWNKEVISTLGKVSDEILDLCGDPKEEKFHIKGLILGDVQSGKTSNYTAIANKAADVGYDIIIVLAGIPELLRQQTQKRLDYELCGRKSNLYLDPTSTLKNQWVGVAKFGDKKNIAVFTSEATDFNVQVLKSNNLSLDNVNCPILLVVKKNKTILDNLYNWLSTNNVRNSNGQIDKSLLIIDDEADNASINTSKPDADPTAINKAIRSLYSIFAKTTYLAVTATPFANIFINPDPTEDLFPSDFIYALDAPTNYIGADSIFSENAEHSDMIVIIDSGKFRDAIPDKHKKDYVVKKLPEDLYDACNYFLLANAIRDCRGDLQTHRSMMIHISRFINVQHQIAEKVNVWLDQVKSDLHNYAKLPVERSEKIKSIHALHMVWDRFSLEEKAKRSWEDILQNYLYKAAAPIDVREVNGKAGSTLDYDSRKEDGFRVIAVGGNTLSRGLTLEGLMVTYFNRNTNMYDTLMQMGRWFGYRPNYSDLVKIWLSEEECGWYSTINEATQDLREQIKTMKIAKQSPKDFGLKVRQDPGSLIVTAKAKMRSTVPINCPINVSGHLLETPRLYASNEILQQNEIAVRKFVNSLSSVGKRADGDEKARGNFFWEGVPNTLVSELINNFQTHPWHLSYNGKALADYISKDSSEWDVVLMNTGDGPCFGEIACGEEIIRVNHTEQRNVEIADNVLTISGHNLKVGSGGCAAIGLDRERAKQIRREYFEKKKKNTPDYAYLVKDRPPILMIHIIQAKYSDTADCQKYPMFLFALGVGFPKNDDLTKTAKYIVNLVEIRNWIDPEADVEE